ncbi:M48 family metallopeptidase [Lentibacter algarum]|uniref:M48 family metallopeptidase n=1 Tax=Lentibacter algarum TaxID=576131 RepID=UPI001C08EFD3|nr:M48 family metallopeptidase [Lentibacter algarum]MBU2983618.1 M48 family metallopeptidase [Lentibacter algarum]
MQEAAGSYFDGLSAAKHKVVVRLDEATGYLTFEGESLKAVQHWRLEDLRLLADQPGGGWLTFTRYTEHEDETLSHEARLSVRDGAMNARLREIAPRLKKRDVHRGTGMRVVKTLAAAIAAVCLMLFVILPAMADTLARMMPREREVQFGRAVIAQVKWFVRRGHGDVAVCEAPDGLAALKQMEVRLTAEMNMEYELDIQVFDHPMVNAFAAPGGQIVIMRGLLDDATSADAVAGVLAHEIGHVENRDATRGALRAAGSAGLISMVFGDFSGGALAVVLAEQMLETSYTREAEAKADDYALEALKKAEVSGEGLATFFDYVLGLESELPGALETPAYLRSHPPSLERANKARSFAGTQGATTSVLSDADWSALQSICD